ncbi:serine/threonine protein kinase [Hyalangium versicolor]|uniref:serine/threonine protein kinase n=1 Tax=Hyalangium versicolor TaxID=2861190 RepID=UPI001CC975DD|nr:serine/threonine-protein kinase [Hyalangium versicolor]
MMEEVDPDNLPVGTMVDSWRVVRRVDGGAYGTLYEVEKDGESYALKMARYLEQSQDARHTDARAQRELSCMLSLRHRYIARVWAHGRWPHAREGFFYVVMDFVKGYTLDEWAERSRMTPHEAVVLADRLLEALTYMHGQGIFHRDLKPGNILVRAQTGEPVIVDYGVAHFPIPAAPQLTSTRLPPGTPRYTSPEAGHFEAEHRHDKAARYGFKVTDEVYALGVTLYDLLTDPRPHSHPEPQPLSPLGFPPAHEVNERVPVPLSHFVARLVALKPEQRPVSAEAARRDLPELLSLQADSWMKRPLQALPPQSLPEAAPPKPALKAVPAEVPRVNPVSMKRRGASRMALAAVGLGALVVCGAYLMLGGGRPGQEVPSEPRIEEAPSQMPPTPEAPARPPALPMTSPSPAHPPLPQPAPSQPVAPSEKGPPVNTRRSPEAAVSSLCSQKTPPARGTPKWLEWCKCAAIAGTIVASQAGCPAAQVRQSIMSECRTESVEAMKLLEISEDGNAVPLAIDAKAPCDKRGGRICKNKITATANQSLTSKVTAPEGKLVEGTLVSGKLFHAPSERSISGRTSGLYFRWNEVTLPDGSKYPVCLEAAAPFAEPGPTPGTWIMTQGTLAGWTSERWDLTRHISP